MSDASRPVLFIVDADPHYREMIRQLARSQGHDAETFANADEFLARHRADRTGALALDLPGIGVEALELPRQLLRRGVVLPMILMSRQSDVTTAVQAVQEGAVTFLPKPFSLEDFWRHVARAFEIDRQRRQDAQARADFSQRFESLNEQEHRILDLMIDGQLNKVIAKRLDVSLRTVERVRAQILKKMNVQSVPQLIERVVSKR
jgi:FixJ family two-component response regulator